MTAENFQACLAFALKYEGGRSNDPRDPGGRTMEGVMQATYDAYRVKKGVGRADVYTISAAERDEIYRKEYWDLIKGDGLRSGEDLCVFDFAVNSGVARARDLSAVWRTSPVNDAIAGMCAHRLSFLHALRTWSHFGAGWGRRVAACEALAIRMANGKIAPEILARKASAANFHSGKKTTQAAVGGAIMGSATIAHALHGGMSGTTEIVVLGAVAFLSGIFVFHAWRHRQRADALGAAVAAIKAQREMLEQKTTVAIAEAALARKEVDKKAQELALAQKSISDLGVRQVETKT
jgi:lysozyme family protein